jgi:PAS domain S-box-containing protein
MVFFIALAGLLLIYITISFLNQQSKIVNKEKELETVLNRIDDAVVSIDNEWRYTFLNDAALMTHPQGKEKILGKFLLEVHPELKGTIFWHKYQEAMRTKNVVEVESYYPPMSRWFSVKVYPSIDGLTIFYRDVTETKKSEQELSQTLKEINDYKFALDEASIVAITDQKGIIKHANANFCKISKYTTEELIGQDHRIINSGYHSKEFIKNLWTTIANGKIWKGELKNKAKDGTIYWVDTTIVPFLDEKGKPYQYVAIRADITERKQAEERIIDLNVDLEKKVKERTQQLKKSNEELEAFSYSVSHDLRAPLRGIIGFASILEEDYGNVLDDEGKRITDVIKSNTMKMGRLIDDLLAFSRMGRQDILKTNIDTHKMVTEVIDELEPKEKLKQIHWKIHPLPMAKGDINTLRQVWINFISNAIKYSGNKEKQCIEIGFGDHGAELVFYVKDNGVGFDEHYKNKLFKVFQRLHSAEEFEGTGVGLALVEKIISKHGGRVWAEGKNNEGACFYFSLPA